MFFDIEMRSQRLFVYNIALTQFVGFSVVKANMETYTNICLNTLFFSNSKLFLRIFFYSFFHITNIFKLCCHFLQIILINLYRKIFRKEILICLNIIELPIAVAVKLAVSLYSINDISVQ